ncbi:MAG: ferritin family protein [Candidatus Heimdallarchaeota archaeon]
MENENGELLEILEENRKLELQNIKISQEKEEQLKSAGAKLILYQIRMDSTKHAKILQTLIDTIKEGTPEYLWDYRIDRYVGQVATEQALQKHVEIEKEMIQRHEAMIKKTDNQGVKLILQHIVDDEKRHHKMLKEVIKQLHKLGP